jgi:hypothetical protein
VRSSRLVAVIVVWGLVLGGCGGGDGRKAGSAADEHARASCRSFFDAAAAFKGLDPTDESDENQSKLDAMNQRYASALTAAVTEARAAAKADATYQEFATGIEAREAVSHGSESGRELEAQTATLKVIAPTCARLGVGP